MKIAITGGAGFIGSHLTQAYLDAGHDVFVIDNLMHGCRQAIDPRARFYDLDIRDSKLQTVLQTERPDLLSHHAIQRENAWPEEQPLADADVHVRGLLNILDSCVSSSVHKIIFASGGNDLYSCACEQPQEGVVRVKEDAPLCPRRPSDISKIAGEWYLRYYTHHYGLTHTILRYADVYGETNRTLISHPLSYFICMLLEQHRPAIRGAADELHDHIFIDDVVKANLYALNRADNATLHISSAQGYSLNQLYHAVADLLDSEIKPVYLSGPLKSEWQQERPSIVLDNTRAQHLLGWRPTVALHEGIQYAIERLAGQKKEQVNVEVKTREAVPQGARTEYSVVAALV